MEYMLHWWGGCYTAVKAKYNYEEYLYFNNPEDRSQVEKNLLEFENLGLMIRNQEGEFIHKDTIAKVTLNYQGNVYIIENNFGKEFPISSAEFMFFEGNYSCDCNKSLFIQRSCDKNFPELNCGDEIIITDFEIIYK